MPRCAIEAELARSAAEALARLVDIARKSLEAFRANHGAELMKLDKELENALGEKERTLGALRQHRLEHKCFLES